MRNECLRLIGAKPLEEVRKQDTYIVAFIEDGVRIEKKLPKEKAQSLYRKVRSRGIQASMDKEIIKKEEKPQIPISEMW